jgi:glycerate 2-kinase
MSEMDLIKNKKELIKNGISESDINGRKIVLDILEKALLEIHPKNLIKDKVKIKNGIFYFVGNKINIRNIENIYVIGAGKASGYLAEGLEEKIGKYITDGVIVVLSGTSNLFKTSKIRIIEATHPIPSEKSIEAARELLKLSEKTKENDLIIFLISGGGSSLTTYPPDIISLDEIKTLNKVMIECGANIKEINILRKHISKIAGGRLAERIQPARGIAFIISDVVGDSLDSISSGLTSPDDSTYSDALSIIKKYDLQRKIPRSIIKYLDDGNKGKLEETPKSSDPIFSKISNIIIGSNTHALQAAFNRAKEHNLNPLILTSMYEGEASNLGLFLSNIAKEVGKNLFPIKKPALIILGGESVVKVTKKGKGGRNQMVALSALINFGQINKMTLCCASTDGVDGNSEAAGAIIDSSTIKRMENLTLDPIKYLRDFNSNLFFKRVKDEIITGPTGTNVNDINLLLIQ